METIESSRTQDSRKSREEIAIFLYDGRLHIGNSYIIYNFKNWTILHFGDKHTIWLPFLQVSYSMQIGKTLT